MWFPSKCFVSILKSWVIWLYLNRNLHSLMDSAELLSCGQASTELWVQLGQSAFSYCLAGNAEPASLSWLELSLLRTRWGFGLWKALGPAVSQASRKTRQEGRAGREGELTLMEAQSPQDPLGLQLWVLVVSSSCWQELVSSGPSGSWSCWRRWGKVGRSFLCMAVEGVCLQRTQERRSLMWKTGFLCLV